MYKLLVLISVKSQAYVESKVIEFKFSIEADFAATKMKENNNLSKFHIEVIKLY